MTSEGRAQSMAVGEGLGAGANCRLGEALSFDSSSRLNTRILTDCPPCAKMLAHNGGGPKAAPCNLITPIFPHPGLSSCSSKAAWPDDTISTCQKLSEHRPTPLTAPTAAEAQVLEDPGWSALQADLGSGKDLGDSGEPRKSH